MHAPSPSTRFLQDTENAIKRFLQDGFPHRSDSLIEHMIDTQNIPVSRVKEALWSLIDRHVVIITEDYQLMLSPKR
jgi:hypothetical protein